MIIGQNENVGYSIRETPTSIASLKGDLVKRAVAADFFKSERNQPLFTSPLNEHATHYKTKRAIDDFPFNDFLGTKPGDKIILTKDQNGEGMPNYGFSTEDFMRSVEIRYRNSGGYDLILHESEKATNGDDSERRTSIIFTSDHKIGRVYDSKKIVNKNLVGRFETHGIHYAYTRKGDKYEVRIDQVIDDESDQSGSASWKYSDKNPKIDRQEQLKFPDNYLMQNLPPDQLISQIPVELFRDATV